MNSIKNRALAFYQKHELKMDIAFFLAGFIFDVFTLSDIDDPISITQQVVYLLITGSILYYNFLQTAGLATLPKWLSKIWNFHDLILHFILGGLLSTYSLFFLKSSSAFSSIIFVVVLMALMIANELKLVQARADLKIGFYFICLFSFFSMMYPTILGFVGAGPFFLAFATTTFVIYLVYRSLMKRVPDQKELLKRVTLPAGSVVVVFLLFYILGWIPPVPLSVKNMGVYHAIDKVEGQYILSHENPWWRFWKSGDQDFKAEPGDKVHFFAQIFSPGRFDDSVILHWYYKDPRAGWQSTDRISMRVTGGRKNGYRGYSVKQNYTPGEWRISVETTDAREIGRMYFDIEAVPVANPDRRFETIIY